MLFDQSTVQLLDACPRQLVESANVPSSSQKFNHIKPRPKSKAPVIANEGLFFGGLGRNRTGLGMSDPNKLGGYSVFTGIAGLLSHLNNRFSFDLP